MGLKRKVKERRAKSVIEKTSKSIAKVKKSENEKEKEEFKQKAIDAILLLQEEELITVEDEETGEPMNREKYNKLSFKEVLEDLEIVVRSAKEIR